MRWTVSRYADLIPLLTFVVGIGCVFLIDRERREREESDRQQAESVAERRAGALADVIGNEVSARIGALAAAELQFTSVEDSVSQRTLLAALDTVTRRSGLLAISVVYPSTGRVLAAGGSILSGSATIADQDSAVRMPYLRALSTREPSASGVIDRVIGRRVLVFRPVERGDSVPGILVAEIDPHAIYRTAFPQARLDTLPQGFQHTLYGPNGVYITAAQASPSGWTRVSRAVRVADTEWTVVTAYPPPDPQVYRAQRVSIWVAGTALSLAISLILLFLRRTINTQRDEIGRRQVAEAAARSAAAEARERAREARDLAAQLEAAQRASQRLSTSLDPDDVVELFLGGVAEILDADVASLYTFEEEGELVVGRKRMVLREVQGVTERFRHEDILQVRAPVKMLPHLAEPVATGEPFVRSTSGADSMVVTGGSEPNALVSVPLMIAGHTVGVATWEVFAGPARFSTAAVTFAQALAAPAAAALRTAELFSSLEAERRRAAREALRFAAVIDQMADGVVVVDADGRVERSNASANELLGEDLASAPTEQWPARFDLATVEGRTMAPADFPLTRAMRGERVRRANFIVKNPWGTERHLSSSAGPILGTGGEPSGAAMVLRDVSDEHQYAEMLRHTNRELRRQAEMLEEVNEQLREATRAKDQFLAVMSHELRTPINAIMGYSDLLDLGVKGDLNDDQRAMLSRVRDTSRHLLGLINEVLDLAKIGAGRMDLLLTELPVREVVERAAQQIMPIASGKGLGLEVEVPPRGEDVVVVGDETRLTQIVINLLSNAVKFTPAGSITIGHERNGDRVEIYVRDTGPGISADQLERIFEEFYQVEGGLARASGGTGLGLAIARRFARLMGGDITVSSTPGAGAEFRVQLPAAGVRPDGPVTEATVVALVHDERAALHIQQDLAGSVQVLSTIDPMRVATLVRQAGASAVALDARSEAAGAWLALTSMQHEPRSVGVRTLLFAHEDDNAEMALELGRFLTLGKALIGDGAAELIQRAAGGAESGSVLIAESDAEIAGPLADVLSAAGWQARVVPDGPRLLAEITERRPEVIVLDLLAPGMTGVEVMARLRADPALRDIGLVVLLARDLTAEEIDRLDRSVAALSRGRRARVDATAELIRGVLRSDNPAVVETGGA